MSSDSPYTQAGRRLELTTDLGDDVLLLTSFRIEEQVSRLFTARLEMLSSEMSIEPADIVGKSVGITLTLQEDHPRYFHGVVRTFEAGELADAGLRRYRAEVVPWLWKLTRTTDCRVFQDMTAVEIVEKVLTDAGFSDFEKDGVKGSPPKREYCVQYRESDFNFVTRLLEEEGIFFWFRHEETKHVMVMADDKSAYQDCRENEVKYSDAPTAEPHVVDWLERWEFPSGVYAHTDYNFKTPATSLLATTNTVIDLPDAADFELFDYPGLYEDKSRGDALAKIRMEEREADYRVVTGASTCCSFELGGKFKLTQFDPNPDQVDADTGWVIVGIKHEAQDESYSAGVAKGVYYNEFRSIPEDVPYRPARSTRKPTVEGPQTATVVGPDGEEIYTDEYGRIKVQFHWDREAKDEDRKEKSSCWVRVAQLWAGKNWGFHFWPRIGQEVVVDFLEGDPDRPLIVGRVYNDENKPPYALPANQTQSGIKTRSSKEGSEENFNEIRFEDKKDSEEIYIHAEKDFKRVVENNDILEVGVEKGDPGDQTITVKNHRTATIKSGDETLTVETGKRTTTVEGDDTHQIKSGNRSVKVDSGNDELTVSSGDMTVTVSSGTVTIEAGTKIELKVGGSSVTIESASISIKSTEVKIEAQAAFEAKGATAKVEGSGSFEAKGAMAKVEGSGMLTLKGGITMIN